MARPLRIEYADAWYHIMNRGRRSELIFIHERDYSGFIELLKDTSEMWNLRITAYCLMPSHYHILVQTPDANISRCMRHIDGVYTQRFNRSPENWRRSQLKLKRRYANTTALLMKMKCWYPNGGYLMSPITWRFI